MKTVHFVLQGKGGVGKSLISSILTQFLSENGHCIAFDTDPVNATLFGFKSLNVQRLEIMKKDDIDARSFDTLIQQVVDSEKEQFVVDNGASSFVPLSSYIIQNDVISLFSEMGLKTVIHTVVTGGQSLLDTIAGFKQLVEQYPDECIFVVWVNPFWGPVEANGKNFENMKAYLDVKDKVSGVVYMPEYKEATFGVDIRSMLEDKITFDEAINSATFNLMSRQRLKKAKNDFWGLLHIASSSWS